jgi:hypothetical protein
MPLVHMKEIYTPLRLLGIKLFRSKEGQTYIKIDSKPRKRLFGGGKQDVSYKRTVGEIRQTRSGRNHQIPAAFHWGQALFTPSPHVGSGTV